MSRIHEAMRRLEQSAGPIAADPPPRPSAPPPAGSPPVSEPKLGAGGPVLPFNGRPNRAAEQYRIIRTKLVQHPDQPQVVLVSSPGAGDGKTVTALNLAGALALKAEASVLLVDADLRHSSISTYLGLPPQAGLTEVLRGQAGLNEAVAHLPQLPALTVLPAGEPCPHPTELLDSPAWHRTMEDLRRMYRFVVLDAPPVGAVADYDLIQAAADGILLVLRPDLSARTACRQALEALPPGKLLGVVLNHVPDWFLWKRGRSYYEYGRKNGK